MRLLTVNFSILLAVFLLVSTQEVLAVSLSATHNLQKHTYSHFKDKVPNNSGDVWDRIRLGMKIPSPVSPQIVLKSVAIPEKGSPRTGSILDKPANAPVIAIDQPNKYTALGLKLRFGAKEPSVLNDGCTTSISSVVLQDKTPKLGSYKAAINNLTPCNKTPDVATSKQAMQTEAVEKVNARQALINDRINKQIALFSQSPSYLYQVAERARPYLFHIVEGLSTNQLPLELALLPIVESGYQPTAVSPKGAAGLWQFILSTGKDYDLKQDNHYDERLDIMASTHAAIRFLSDLKAHFNGDWLLALAAYNCGAGAVDKAIGSNMSSGLETDYWSLSLPEETQDYVPRLLALSKIFASPENYGLKFTPIKNEPYFVKVKINREVDIKYLTDKKFAALAKLANLSHEQFNQLNPGYLNPALSSASAYTFLLPLANADQLHRLLTSVAQFMAEPVSLVMANKKPDVNAFSNAQDLSPNLSSSNLIRSSLLSREIY